MLRRGPLVAIFVLFAATAFASPHRRRPHTRQRPRVHRSHTPPARRAPTPAPVVAVRPPLPSSPRPALGTPSPGCSARDATTAHGVTEASLAVGSLERTYLLSVPERSGTRGPPLPLVFAFHGLTGTPTSLRGYLHVEREAAGGAIFVYPAGLRRASARGRSTTHWDLHADGVDVAFFDALLAHLGRAYCVDLGRVFAVGHSAGAVVTNEMGCHRGNVLRAIAPIAGSGPWSRRCTDAPSVWLTHGRADEPVPFHYGESSRDHWVAAARCAPAPTACAGDPSCVRYTGCGEGASVVFCEHGGDHGPPPFAPRGVWSFFTSQGMP